MTNRIRLLRANPCRLERPSSLLFEDQERAASCKIGDYFLVILANGDIRICWDNQIYKSPSQYPEELTRAIKDRTLDRDTQVFDGNWFELVIFDGHEHKVYCAIVEDDEVCTDEKNLKKLFREHFNQMLEETAQDNKPC